MHHWLVIPEVMEVENSDYIMPTVGIHDRTKSVGVNVVNVTSKEQKCVTFMTTIPSILIR